VTDIVKDIVVIETTSVIALSTIASIMVRVAVGLEE
jgi:hypothetical protein